MTRRRLWKQYSATRIPLDYAKRMRMRDRKSGKAFRVPTFLPNGSEHPAFHRIKFDPPVRGADGKPVKTKQAADQEARISFMPLTNGKSWEQELIAKKQRWYWCESDFKAAALAAVGKFALTTGSAWSHRKRTPAGESTAISDLNAYDFKGARVTIVPDNDVHGNSGVQDAVFDLDAELRKRGADTSLLLLPPPEFDPATRQLVKQGMDDYMHAHGYRRAALKSLPILPLTDARFAGWGKYRKPPTAALPSSLRNLKPVPADWWDSELPPAENIVECYLQVMENAIVAGQGGTGKTFWLLYLQAAVASGSAFFGYGVPRKRRVLYLSLERNADNFRRRWKKVTSAVADELEPGPRAKFIAAIKANCYVRCLAGESIPLIEFKDNQWVPTALVDELIGELKTAQIEVMFLDPYSRLHGADENSSSVASAITRALERIAQEAGCSVVLCHHTGKQVAQGQNAPRGSSALVDNTSQCVVITKIEYDEAVKTLNLEALTDDERRTKRDIVCVDHVRASDGPTANRMYFVRQSTGLLRQIKVDRITLDTRISGIIGTDCSVCEWADGQPFTKTQFRDQRLQIFGGEMSERDAEKAFDALVADGDFIPFMGGGEHIKRKGGLLYTIRPQLLEQTEPGRRAGAGRSTAPLNGSRRRERAKKR